MERTYLRSKIHRGRVTETDKEYDGSVTIDAKVLRTADIDPYEQVQVVNITNGQRLWTYAIEGASGELCLNGAAARMAAVGDRVIVMAYGSIEDGHHVEPTIVHLDEQNRIVKRK